MAANMSSSFEQGRNYIQKEMDLKRLKFQVETMGETIDNLSAEHVRLHDLCQAYERSLFKALDVIEGLNRELRICKGEQPTLGEGL